LTQRVASRNSVENYNKQTMQKKPPSGSFLQKKQRRRQQQSHPSGNGWSIHVSEVSIPKLQRILKRFEGKTDMGIHRNAIRRQVKSLKLLIFLSSRLSEDAVRHSLLQEMEKMQVDTYRLNETNLVAVALATKSNHSLQYALAAPTNPVAYHVQESGEDVGRQKEPCTCPAQLTSTSTTSFGYPEPGCTESIFHQQRHKSREGAPKDSGAVLKQVANWPLSLRDPQPTHASASWSGASRLAHHKPSSSASRTPTLQSRIEELLRLEVGACSKQGAGPAFMDYITA
jgi:hypothetical protein